MYILFRSLHLLTATDSSLLRLWRQDIDPAGNSPRKTSVLSRQASDPGFIEFDARSPHTEVWCAQITVTYTKEMQ